VIEAGNFKHDTECGPHSVFYVKVDMFSQYGIKRKHIEETSEKYKFLKLLKYSCLRTTIDLIIPSQ